MFSSSCSQSNEIQRDCWHYISIILQHWLPVLMLRLTRETNRMERSLLETNFGPSNFGFCQYNSESCNCTLLQRFKAIAYCRMYKAIMNNILKRTGRGITISWTVTYFSPSLLEASPPLELHPPPLPTVSCLCPECNSCSVEYSIWWSIWYILGWQNNRKF